MSFWNSVKGFAEKGWGSVGGFARGVGSGAQTALNNGAVFAGAGGFSRLARAQSWLGKSPLRAGLAAAGIGALGVTAAGGALGAIGPGDTLGGMGGVWTGAAGGAIRGGLAGAGIMGAFSTARGVMGKFGAKAIASNAGRSALKGGMWGAIAGLGLGAITGSFGGGLQANRPINRIRGLGY